MADFRKYFRPQSAKPRTASAKRNRIASDVLKDLAQDPQRIPSFASSLNLRSKSAKLFDEEFSDTKKEAKKQAWAPKPKQNLASSSTQFQRYGRSDESGGEVTAPVKKRQEQEFGRAEDHIYLTDLIKLKEIFYEADEKGDGTIHMDDFLLIFDKLFGVNGKNEEEILTFFHKIDYNCDGYICWGDFCTYMQLELQERDDIVVNSKMVEFQLPAHLITYDHNPHKDSVCRISHMSDGLMVTCSQDGVVCFWSHDYQPRRTRKAEYGLTGKPKWVTDMALCKSLNKILLTTGDHEIQFYEMMNFEPYCQLRKLDTVPLRVDFWSNPQQVDECIILVGDNEGTVTVIKTTNIKEAFKYWKRGARTEDGMPTYSIDKLVSDKIVGTSVYRWRLHMNWVTEVHYFPSLHCFVSCSCDPVNSVVMGSPSGSTPVDALLQGSWPATMPERAEEESQEASPYSARPRAYLVPKNRNAGDQRVFKVPKGVSTLDFCSKNGLLVTGGLDQLIRLWNPFINNKPVAKLYGQNSPVFKVQVDSLKDRVYSIGNDNSVKVWHLLDHTCLFTIIASLHKLTSAVECFYFNPLAGCLVLAAEQMAVLKMTPSKAVRTDIVQSHLQAVTAIKYSHCFHQVITSCEGAAVKVWEISNGKNIFEFCADMGKDVGIRSMDVDRAGKRIATCGENGVIKLWNYSNGQCVRILDKGNSQETSDIKFITLNDNRYIIATGWDRKIHLFPDMPGRHVHQVVKPIENWSSSSTHGHSEDILSITVGLSNLMATSSYDGEVIIWSVVSCHMLTKLQVSFSAFSTSHNRSMNEDRAVYKVLFLERRAHLSKTAATLVASGPHGKVHFWNVYDGSMPMGVFRACHSSCLSDMVVDESNSILVVVDTQGYVEIFNIKNFCIRTKSKDPPRKVVMWRAHTQRVSSIMIVDHWNTLITGSMDGAVRLWTLHGQYIGTFGQEQLWNLGDPGTYQHPLIPEDVFLDKHSLSTLLEESSLCHPKPVLERELGEPMESLKVESVEDLAKIAEPKQTMAVPEVRRVEEEDELLQSHICMKVPSFSSSQAGKRLRHLRAHSAIKKDETKSKAVYGHLPYQPLTNDAICYQIQPPIDVQRPPKFTAGIC